MTRRSLLLRGSLLAFLALTLAPRFSRARPGGGQTYQDRERPSSSPTTPQSRSAPRASPPTRTSPSPGSVSTSGSSSGTVSPISPSPPSPPSDSGGCGLFLLLFLLLFGLISLVFEHPKIGVPLVFGLLLGGLLWYSDDGARILGYGLLAAAVLACVGGALWVSPLLGLVVLCLLVLVLLGHSWWDGRSRSSGKGWESGIVEPAARSSDVRGPAAKGHPSNQALLSMMANARQPAPVNLVRQVRSLNPRERLELIRSFDPDFSTVLFEDFLALLFTEVHTARGNDGLHRLAPYLSPKVAESLVL